eukprot:COSAG05_NODE_976_length_6334_cov_4.837851_4_plen_157_part_00
MYRCTRSQDLAISALGKLCSDARLARLMRATDERARDSRNRQSNTSIYKITCRLPPCKSAAGGPARRNLDQLIIWITHVSCMPCLLPACRPLSAEDALSAPRLPRSSREEAAACAEPANTCRPVAPLCTTRSVHLPCAFRPATNAACHSYKHAKHM